MTHLVRPVLEPTAQASARWFAEAAVDQGISFLRGVLGTD